MTNAETLEKLYRIAPVYCELFDHQLEFVLAPHRYVSALCSRRAGKTTVCAVKSIQLLSSRPNSIGIYLALTDRSVEDIFMPVITPLVNKYKIKCKVNRDEILFDNGSKLLIAGANHPHKIETFRGVKLSFCIIDEAASFSERILHYLIDEVIGPALADLRGQLMLIGTPKAHCSGMFYDVTTGKEPGWLVKKWTCFENPHVAKEMEEDLALFMQRKQIDIQHPKVRREYFGEWLADDDSLMIKPFQLVVPPSAYNTENWRSVIGVDFGFNDETAFSVIGWERNNPKSYVLETFGQSGMSVSDIGNHLNRLKKKYSPVSIVGDPAGASKIIMQEFLDKHKIYMESAQKRDKAHYIEIMNDALINSNLVLCPETTKVLQQQMRKVVWNEERTTEREGTPCDHLDATLYAYRASLAFTEKIYVKKEVTDEERVEEMLRKQIERDRERFETQKGSSFFDDIAPVIQDTYWG